MFCPHCWRALAAVRCPHCLEQVDVGDVERAARLAYLRNRLEDWATRGVAPRWATENAVAETEGELRALHVRLGLLPAPSSTLPWPTSSAPLPEAAVRGSARREADGAPRSVPPVATSATPRVRRPRPDRPPLTWRHLGLALLSERTLNTLLLVGALLILASASVISTLNPTRLSPVPHLGALVATTAVFAAAGVALRRRLGLPRTGSALLAIAAAFLPLDVWTLSAPELLRWTPATTWLAASLLCLLAYLSAHLFLRDRTFALLTTAAGASLALAVSHRLGIPADWWGASLVALAILYVTLIKRVQRRLLLLAWALRHGGHILALGALALFTLMAGASLAGLAVTTVSTTPLAAIWWLVTLFYALYARVSATRYYATVAASTSAVAALLTLRLAAPLAPALKPWSAVAIALLAGLYGGYGYVRDRRAGSITARQALARPPYHVGATLSSIALVWPDTAPLERAIAATVLAALYAVGVRRVRGLVPATIAVALLPLILADLIQALSWPDSLLTWAIFALATLGLAEYATRWGVSVSPGSVRRSQGTTGRRAAQRASGAPRGLRRPVWRSPFALPLLMLSAVAGLGALGVCLVRYGVAFTQTGLSPRDGETVAATALLTCGVFLLGQRRGILALRYLAPTLAVLPYLSLAVACGERLGWRDAHAGLAWSLMLAALAYLGVAALVDAPRRNVADILYPPAYLCAALAPALVLADAVTLSWLFGLALAASAWSAWLVATGRHHAYETWLAALMPPAFRSGARALFGYLCAWLFPLWLLIAASARFPALSPGVFGLILTALSAVYLTGALPLTRSAPIQARPWLSAGVLLSALGPLLALGDPWPRLAACVLALVVYAAMAGLSRRPAWAYGVALILPVAAYALMERAALPYDEYGLGALPVVLLLLGVGGQVRARGLGRAWVRPFDVVAHGLLALLLLGAVPAVFLAGDGRRGAIVVTALAYALSLAVYASRRQHALGAWFAAGYALVAAQGLLLSWRIPIEDEPVCWAAIGLAVALSRALFRPSRSSVWARPLEATSAALALLTPLAAASLSNALPENTAVQTFTTTMEIVGLQAVMEGLARRQHRLLIYAGVACEGVAYLVQLVQHGVAQPQLYAVPMGLYLLGVAYVEWRIAPRHPAKKTLEVSGLLILVGTSLLQAMGFMTDHSPSSIYDLIVIVEGLALLWVGNYLHWKNTLAVGAIALCVDAALVVGAPLRAVDSWYVVAIAGLAIIGFVIMVEKKRQSIAVLVGQWRRLRETWY